MPLDPELEPHVTEAARLNNLDPNLLRSLLSGESSNDPNAVSPKGAIGIAQFMPETAAKMGIDPRDPVQGIYGAADLLNHNLSHAEQLRESGQNINPVDHALRMYFAGDEGPQWGPNTAAYPGYIYSRYRQLSQAGQPAAGTPDGGDPDALLRQQYDAATTRYHDSAPGETFEQYKARWPDARPGGSMNGIDALATAGQPQTDNLMQLAQAGRQPAIPSDEELLQGLREVAPMFSGGASAPSAPAAPAAAPSAPAPAQGASGFQYADPGNSLFSPQLKSNLAKNASPITMQLLQHATELEKSGFQLNQDGSQSVIRGGPADPTTQNRAKAAEASGGQLQTFDPVTNAVGTMPGANEAAQAREAAKAAGAGTDVSSKQAISAFEEGQKRETQAQGPQRERSQETTYYPPGSAGAKNIVAAQEGGKSDPNVQVDPAGGVHVSNTNVPGDVVHLRYEALGKLQDEAGQARQGIYEAQQLQQKLRDIGTSGPMTDYLGKLSSLAQQIGVPEETIKKAALPAGASVEEANKLSTDLLGAILHQTFPQRITNTDITAWKNTVPRATTLQEANDYLINNIVIPKFQRSIDRYGYASGLSSTDPQLTSYYKALNDWDNSHPFDAYQIAKEFKSGGTASPGAGSPGGYDRATLEGEMRRRGLLK